MPREAARRPLPCWRRDANQRRHEGPRPQGGLRHPRPLQGRAARRDCQGSFVTADRAAMPRAILRAAVDCGLRRQLRQIAVRLKRAQSFPGSWPATPIIFAPCLRDRGRRDKPGDDADVCRHEIATGFWHICHRTTIVAVRSSGASAMCDYSLQFVASRPAMVVDELVSTKFTNAITAGFFGGREPKGCVCPPSRTGGAVWKKGGKEAGFFPSPKRGEKV